ncbi:sialic acid-binding Ig-like lectin 5 isoform X2 [Oryzias latipes]|uniref:sialic acid-binding Ig-like lectin 5 isoform X2 n=1 Tax=Oryzias latipes TaxID=8090 RepID=UPI000CE239F1|nr:sialic acid-binding Ig-like lectin 5 isoform X2 [Oryzias latipes]
MFHLLWASLIFPLISIGSSAGSSVLGQPSCFNGFCISVSDEKITAESGLCVVIPCSFQTPYYFVPQHLVWFKCESDQRCSDSNIIFHTNKNTNKPLKSEFLGRVSLLDPDLNQNCSIMISDMRESDSGFYQLRVNGYIGRESDGFTFGKRRRVDVGGSRQKPTVTLPDLTVGHQATLTCTAPALCSKSPPGITWMWRGAAENDPLTNGSITAFKESLTAVTQRHHSTLTFIPTTEHHNSKITCRIQFSDDTTTEKTVNLHVNYVKITGNTDLKEGMTLNLICTTTSVTPAEIRWIRFGSKTDQLNRTSAGLPNNTAIYLQEDRSTLLIFNVTAEDAGLYICTSKHLNNTIKDEVNVTVMYARKPQISGKVIVKEGEVLNLTCSVDSFPPAVWTGLWSNLHNGSDHNGSATLIVTNVTAEDSGRYFCAVNHQNWTETVHVDVTVMLEGSACVRRSDVLTCTCIGTGFPLPNIKWAQLSPPTVYWLTTNVSGHTVRSSLTLKATNQDNVSAECVISNESGESTEKLTIQDILFEKDGDQSGSISEKTVKPETIIAFLIGVLTSTIFCILIIGCYRKKLKRFENLVEMVGSQDNPLIHDGLTVAEDPNCFPEGAENEAVSTGEAAPKLRSGSGDVEYASIDFSLLKRRERTQELQTAATEYAEVKVKKEGKHAAGEAEAMMEEDDKTLLCVSKKKDEEEEAVYSSVNDLMDEI